VIGHVPALFDLHARLRRGETGLCMQTKWYSTYERRILPFAAPSSLHCTRHSLLRSLPRSFTRPHSAPPLRAVDRNRTTKQRPIAIMCCTTLPLRLFVALCVLSSLARALDGSATGDYTVTVKTDVFSTAIAYVTVTGEPPTDKPVESATPS